MSIERFHNGRLSVHSHFDHFISRKRSASRRFDDVMNRALHVHMFSRKKGKNVKLSPGKGSREPGRNQIRLTRVSTASKSSKLGALLQHSWPGERLRQDHFRKLRHPSQSQLADLRFEKTQKSRVIVMKEGKLVVSDEDAVLASKVFNIG